MFLKLLSFEAAFQIRQRAFWMFSLLLTFFGFMLMAKGNLADGLLINSNYRLHFNVGISSLGAVFVTMFLAISGAIRDKQHNMEGLIYTTSIAKKQFFWSRFIGVFFFSLLSMTMLIIGLALGTLYSEINPENLATFSLLSYAESWLFFLIPNVFMVSSLLFSISLLNKSTTVTYVGAVMIYVIYMLTSTLSNSPLMAQSTSVSAESLAIAALGDPFGLAAFFEHTNYWTLFQKNNEILKLSGLFLWNRLIWLAFSFAVLGLTYKLFSFGLRQAKIKKNKTPLSEKFEKRTYKPQVTIHDSYSQIAGLWSMIKVQLGIVLKSLPFLAIISLWLFLIISEMYFKVYEAGRYNESWYPTTSLMISIFSEPLPFIAMLLITFYSGEIVWLERSYHLDRLIDATPIQNSTLYFSKLAVLICLPILLIATGILAGIFFQLSSQYYNIEVGQYFSSFYFKGVQYLIYALLALFIQTLMPNKYLGMAVTGVSIACVHFGLLPKLGILHPILNFGSIPQPNFSDMYGYSGRSKAFYFLSVYWLSFCGLLSFISFKLWQRGLLGNLGQRLKIIYPIKKGAQALTISCLGALFLLSAGIVYYNTNVAETYQTTEENLDQRAAYEKKYKQYEETQRPYRVDLKTEMNLYPDKQAYDLTATVLLKNKGPENIQTIIITEREPLNNISIEGGHLIEHDSLLGVYLFHFENEIVPGQEFKYNYDLIHQSQGFDWDQSLPKNGANIMQSKIAPQIGYRSGIEIRDLAKRLERGLEKR